MLRLNPFHLMRRLWLLADRAWIRDRIADEEARHARHDSTMRSLNAVEADIRWKLGERPSQHYGLQSLKPTTPYSRKVAQLRHSHTNQRGN